MDKYDIRTLFDAIGTLADVAEQQAESAQGLAGDVQLISEVLDGTLTRIATALERIADTAEGRPA